MPYLVIDSAAAAAAPVTTLGDPLIPTPPATELPGKSLVVMRTQLDIQLGGRTDFLDTMLDIWINDAYIDLASSMEIDELKGSLAINLVAGQPFYRLPDIVRAIRSVGVIDSQSYGDLGGRKLTKSNLDEYRKRRDLADEPREYFREQDVLVLWPTPTNVRTVSVDFWIRPKPLDGEDNYPILPPEWHEIILRNARTKAHSDLREFEKAAVTNNEFVGLARRKQDTDELEDSDRIVGSSVPRSRRDLFRRGQWRGERDGLR